MEYRDTPWRRDTVRQVVELCRETGTTEELLEVLLSELEDAYLTLALLAARAKQKSHWDAAYTRATQIADDQLIGPAE